MVQVQIAVSDEHYEYLQQRAREQGASREQVVAELIEAEIAWSRLLAGDPMRSLIGWVDDAFTLQDIGNVVYGLGSK
jgi:hypothetical protein